MQSKKKLSGFTLTELLIVFAILGTLFSLSSMNLFGAYHKNTLATTVTTLQADLKQQQLKAMVGDTEGQGTEDSYGIYFEADSYTLFKGTNYTAGNPLNFKIVLNNDLQFSSILVPSSQIIFSEGSGEVANYDVNFDNITLRNTGTDETKTLRINQYGAIISIY